ncbi:MAG: phosphoribosylformylglycinamidine synthase subunit PurQ [Chloroflexi bacterium]|nr:phosphoribosylformylglycinamidine synthase subunit PurQ [Chloroflexota bacterium]
MRFGVVVFPGTQCDRDCHHVLDKVLGQKVDYVWHRETKLSPYDVIVLPGGFSYGDYLRSGAIARFSPVMEAVAEAVASGKLVIGICNGFQILCEAGLLPGALLRNDSLQFRCQWVNLRVENVATAFTSSCQPGQVLRIPIAHGEGRYYADEDTLAQLEAEGQVVLRYCNAQGELIEEANPNGSLNYIAGIVNRERNVFGLMPHPERASEAMLGGEDGLYLFRSLLVS